MQLKQMVTFMQDFFFSVKKVHETACQHIGGV